MNTVVSLGKAIINDDNRLFLFLFVITVVWMSAGIFPLICYEGDSLYNAGGINQLFVEDNVRADDILYGLWMQPLTIYLLWGIKHLMPAVDTETIYCVISSAASIALFYATVLFMARLTRLSKSLCLVALWLLPESYALAMYPNSTSLTMLIIVLALLAITHHHSGLSITLLCIAPLLRLDTISIYPVVLPLWYHTTHNLKESLVKTAVTATAVTLAIFIGYNLTDGNVSYTLQELDRWSDIISLSGHLLTIVSAYSLIGIILALTGVIVMAREHDYTILLTIVLPVLSLHVSNMQFGNAAKHYAPCLPFVAIAVAFSLRKILSWRHSHKPLFYSAVTMIAASLVVSIDIVRANPAEAFIRRNIVKFPTVNILNIPTGGKYNIEVGLGAGMGLYTADEFALISGNLTYPLFIHRVKERCIALKSSTVTAIGAVNPPATIIASTWETYAALRFTPVKDGVDIVYIGSVSDVKDDEKTKLIEYSPDAVDKWNVLFPGRRVYIAVTCVTGANVRKTNVMQVHCSKGTARMVSPGLYELCAYER